MYSCGIQVSELTNFPYRTAILTSLLTPPPSATRTGTLAPAGALCGTRMFICHRPTKPGARPLNRTWAGAPPTVTSGSADVP